MIQFVKLLVKALPMFWRIYKAYKAHMDDTKIKNNVGRAWESSFGVYLDTTPTVPKTNPKGEQVPEQPIDYPRG